MRISFVDAFVCGSFSDSYVAPFQIFRSPTTMCFRYLVSMRVFFWRPSVQCLTLNLTLWFELARGSWFHRSLFQAFGGFVMDEQEIQVENVFLELLKRFVFFFASNLIVNQFLIWSWNWSSHLIDSRWPKHKRNNCYIFNNVVLQINCLALSRFFLSLWFVNVILPSANDNVEKTIDWEKTAL